MLFTSALVLLVLWLIGIFAVPAAGDLVHVSLLAGLPLLLLAFLRARDRRRGGVRGEFAGGPCPSPRLAPLAAAVGSVPQEWGLSHRSTPATAALPRVLLEGVQTAHELSDI
jgi:hypothetical protein